MIQVSCASDGDLQVSGCRRHRISTGCKKSAGAYLLGGIAMDKATFLSMVDTEHLALQNTLAQIDEAHMLQPGVTGEWTVKDIIAHITWSEREMMGILERRASDGGSALWDLPQDERNEQVVKESRARSLAEVLGDARAVYSRLRDLLDKVSDEDLNDPQHLKMPPNWTPWQIFAGSTYTHYRQHREMIKAWWLSI